MACIRKSPDLTGVNKLLYSYLRDGDGERGRYLGD